MVLFRGCKGMIPGGYAKEFVAFLGVKWGFGVVLVPKTGEY